MEIHRVVAEPVPDTARQHMVRMRDGVRLATDVYPVPDAEGPLPAVLVRLPYDKNSRYVFMDKVAERFTARGYVLVVQDVRGKFRSEGETLAWTGEVNDGYDTIDWVVNQEWSNGIVGMFGDSYYGFTQWSAVASEHPALRAIVPRVTSTDIAPGRERSGDPSIRRVPWLEGTSYLAGYWVDNDSYEFEPDLSVRPLVAAFEEVFEAIGARSKGFDLMVPKGIELDSYNAKHPYDARPVPVLHCVGWFDNVGTAHMWDYTQLSMRPGWDAVQFLYADATDHENTALEDAPLGAETDHAADEAALERLLDGYTGPALDFFDVFLKGIAGVQTLPRVRWKLGHVGWHTAEQWPPTGARSVELHLTDLSAAAGTVPGGLLTGQGPVAAGSVRWHYDPDDLVPSAVANTFDFLRTYPDERATADREDVLVFTGEPAAEPLDLAGPVGLLVEVSSTAPTFDVFAKLFDVAPDGSTHMIVRGDAQGEAVGGVLRLDLGHTGYRLRPGHRLALTVTSSDFPLYVPNSGSTENPWLTVAPKPSTQTLRSGVLNITVLS
ncbi:CocE/NonD family hydrolase [Catenulispora rubra]|uniref:CocE/NonD family hydrolase n=1 Tax=Catenulispora rubra TaxID=280293 RepID=UPI002B275B33|nr:CocE/NonD family hydrolase [Catenulispora rubra]